MTDSSGTVPQDPKVLKTSTYSILVLLGNQLILYGTNVLLARWLGAADLGDWSVAQSLALLMANLVGLGTLQTLPRFLPLYLDNNRHDWARGFLQDNLLAVVLASFVVGSIGYGIYLLIKPEDLTHPLGLVWLALPVVALGQFTGNTLLSAHRPLSSTILTLLLWPLLTLVLAASFEFFQGDGLQSREMFWSWGLSLLIMLPLMFYLTRKALPTDLFSKRVARDRTYWIKAGGPLLVSGFVYMLLNQCALYILEHVGAESDVGVFSVVNQTALFITLPMAAAYPVVVPLFPKLLEDKDHAGLKKLVRNTMLGVGSVAGIMTLLILLFGRTILNWFGADFVVGYNALVVVAIGNALIALLTPVWPLLAAAGQTRLMVPATLVALLVNVGLCYALVTSLGSLAAGLGQSVSIFGIYLYLFYYARKKTDLVF
ncbi:lipopolysaccharide biosynthesis protein [Rhodovibrionaceae bacterium A322]